jgi:TonB family protein
MPPTFKGTDLSSSESPAARLANGGRSNPDRARQQTVALEVPVSVNGARPLEGSDKREPFSEATKTVLVHSSGAVIRLSSAVTPGQLLFLTNDKTKKEVVCQVVKSKNDGSASCYVELEFTEPVQGFWGLGFPGERNATSSSSPTASHPAALPPLSQNLDSLSSSPSKPVEPHYSASGSVNSEIPPVDVSALAEEFKTEIKPDSRPMSKADFLTPAETSAQGLKIEANRLQEQLSSLLFVDPAAIDSPSAASTPTPDVQDLGDTAAAKILEITDYESAPRKTEPTLVHAELSTPATPAPKPPLPTTPAFDAEEVKIPAWLEPLARNAAIPAPPEPTVPASSSATSEFEELSAAESQQPSPVSTPRTTASSAATRAPVAPARAAPVFGRTLLRTSADKRARTSSGNKGIWITAIAAGIVLAATGVSWYLRQSPSPAASSVVENSSPISMSAATLPAATVPSIAASNSAPSSNANATTDHSAPEARATSTPSDSNVHSVASSSSAAKLQPAAISERVSNPAAATVDASKTPNPASDEAEPEIKRPSLGNVRLAKPKVNHSARTPLNGDAEPPLEVGNEQLPASESPLSGGLLEGGAKQPLAPAAPVPVGGDVKPARLISSVPPAYPALARTQHVAGDVRVDALIDANGRVSTMKVVSGPTLLHQAAMDALRQWKYQPATLDGKPVAMHLTVTLQFRLK